MCQAALSQCAWLVEVATIGVTVEEAVLEMVGLVILPKPLYLVDSNQSAYEGKLSISHP